MFCRNGWTLQKLFAFYADSRWITKRGAYLMARRDICDLSGVARGTFEPSLARYKGAL
jgi:hypothetical protein